MSRTRLSRLACRSLTILATFCAAFMAVASPSPADDLFDDHYLIVTGADLAPAFAPLIAHRDAQGYQAEVVTMEHVLAVTDPLEDAAATLRSFLAQHHAEHGTAFVLLGGDLSVIPSRICQHEYPGWTEDYPADLYFACFQGTWDADGDGIYAEPEDEPDQEPVLAVGRAPVATVAQAETFVAKVLAYEEDAGGQRSRALLAATVLAPVFWQPGDPVQVDGATYCEMLEPLLAALPPAIESTRMYQNHTAYAGAVPLTVDALLDTLATGRHGLVDMVCRVEGGAMEIGMELMQSDQIAALQNGLICPIALFTMGSGAGFQVDDCLANAGIRNPDGGFVAAFGPTAVPYIVPVGELRDRLFASFETGDPRLGPAWRAGVTQDHPSEAFRFVSRAVALLGDPALMLWDDGIVAIEDEEDDVVPALPAERLVLEPNYPNPFNPRTTLAYSLGDAANVTLAVYDLRGRQVAALVDGERPAGRHLVDWNGTDDRGRVVPAGLYLYRVTADGETRSRRMVLAK